METGSECDGWATLPQSERCAETRGSAAECRGKGGTAECPQTTGAQRKGKKTQVTYQYAAALPSNLTARLQ